MSLSLQQEHSSAHSSLLALHSFDSNPPRSLPHHYITMGPLTIATPAIEQDIESLAAAHTMLTFTLPLRPVQPLFEEHLTASPNPIDPQEDVFHSNAIANTIDAIGTDLDDLLTDLTGRRVQLDTMSTILQWFDDPHSPEIGFPTLPDAHFEEDDDGYWSPPSVPVSASVSNSSLWISHGFNACFPNADSLPWTNETTELPLAQVAPEARSHALAFSCSYSFSDPLKTPDEVRRNCVAKRAAARRDRYRERQRKRLAMRQRRKLWNLVRHMRIAADERERLLYAITPSEDLVHVRCLGSTIIEVS